MDHMPLPNDPLREHPRVPLLCRRDVTFGGPDGQVWLEHDERTGWAWDEKVSGLRRHAVDDTEILELATFLQEWLFFGLLSFSFGRLYRHEDFVDEDGAFLTTVKLYPLVLSWATTLDVSHPWVKTEVERDQLLAAIRLNLEDTWTWLWGLERFEAAQSESIFSNVLLSVECLCKSLEHAVISLQTLRKKGPTTPPGSGAPTTPWSIPSRPWPINASTARQMVAAGWCPYTVRRLGDLLGGPVLWYLSCGKRFGRSTDHWTCTEKICMARKLDKETYKPKHIQDNCRCDLLGPPLEQMCKILEDDAIPLLQITGESIYDAAVVLSSSKDNPDYVALSHVISDGWGNFKDNKLPACQLLRIQKLIDELPGNLRERQNSLWIDSITVPIPDKAMSHHLIAMERMVRSYSEARKVLVLDDELLHTPSSLPVEELQLRIAVSDWMSRLWTLQEGVLTPKDGLYIQLADRTLLYDESFTMRLTRGHPFDDFAVKTLCWTSLLQMENIVGLANFTIPLPRRFDVLLSLFRGRSTSIAGDVPYVFCNLTKIDPAPILRLPYEHDVRQRYLATTQKEWPESMLFLHGSRLHEYGYRWFLSSFIPPNSSISGIGSLRQEPSFAAASSARLGTVMPGKGLLVSYRGYVFSPASAPKNASFDIHIPEDNLYINCGALSTDAAFSLHKYRDIAPGPGKKMAFVQRDRELKPGTNNPAFLVSVVDEDEEVVYCRYEWRLGLLLHMGESRELVSSAWQGLSEEDVAADPKRMIARRSQKKWCVG